MEMEMKTDESRLRERQRERERERERERKRHTSFNDFKSFVTFSQNDASNTTIYNKTFQPGSTFLKKVAF